MLGCLQRVVLAICGFNFLIGLLLFIISKDKIPGAVIAILGGGIGYFIAVYLRNQANLRHQVNMCPNFDNNIKKCKLCTQDEWSKLRVVLIDDDLIKKFCLGSEWPECGIIKMKS